jgi:hypothetical protein
MFLFSDYSSFNRFSAISKYQENSHNRKRCGATAHPDHLRLFRVMAGLVPAIHALLAQLPLQKKGVDASDERVHDLRVPIQFHRKCARPAPRFYSHRKHRGCFFAK